MSHSLTAVARVERGGSNDVAQRLLEAEQWVATAAPRDLAAALVDIRRMNEWLKVVDAAEELRRQALLIEYVGLRRIGGTDYRSQIANAQRRNAALWLSELSDSKFEKLIETISIHYSPVAAYRAHLRREQEVTLQRVQATYVPNANQREVWEEGTNARLREATHTLLTEAVKSGEPFKSIEVAEKLVEALNLSAEGVSRDEMAFGLLGVVQAALRHGGHKREIYVDGELVEMPLIITYRDSATGWTKINFFEASLPQLLAMAKDHEARASAAVVASERLRLLADFYARNAEHPEEPLAKIESRVRRNARHYRSRQPAEVFTTVTGRES